MEQSKLGSLIEAAVNTLIGFALSFLAWPVAGWLFGIAYTHGQHFGVVMFFTLLSVARGYFVRRYANGAIHNASGKLAARLLA